MTFRVGDFLKHYSDYCVVIDADINHFSVCYLEGGRVGIHHMQGNRFFRRLNECSR